MNESIRKDTNSRILGEKLYTDTDWIYETNYLSDNFETESEVSVDITGSGITLYLEKETTLLILVTANIQTSDLGGAIGTLTLKVDATTATPEIEGTDISGEPMTGTIHFVTTLAVGSHTFKLQLRSSVPAPVYVTHRRLSIIKLVE